jgi:CheY-like chemotaxis protein
MRTQKYDLVFTDIKMPGMDGVELAEQVKARQPWTPVVIITGYGTTANESRAKAVGVADFMRKPLSPEMIEESAAHALHQPVVAIAAPLEVSAVEEKHVEQLEEKSNLKNIALFLAAPFIGLAYAVLLPLVGIAMLAWVAGQALFALPATKKTLRRAKDVALFVAAPFIGLAYAVMLPFVGLAMLAWVGLQALLAKPVVA